MYQKKKSISKFRRPSNCQNLLIKLTVKASLEKAWLLCEFPFSLNPGDKPTDAQAWKNYTQKVQKTSSKQIQRKIDGTF